MTSVLYWLRLQTAILRLRLLFSLMDLAGNDQVGAQYAEALAAKGYVVYCFDLEDIPDTYFSMWMTVGRTYAENLLSYEIYKVI